MKKSHSVAMLGQRHVPYYDTTLYGRLIEGFIDSNTVDPFLPLLLCCLRLLQHGFDLIINDTMFRMWYHLMIFLISLYILFPDHYFWKNGQEPVAQCGTICTLESGAGCSAILRMSRKDLPVPRYLHLYKWRC